MDREYRFARFTTLELVWIAVVAALVFAINAGGAYVLTVIAANPSAGGAVMLFVTPWLGILTGLIIRKAGTLTLLALVAGVMYIPTPFITAGPGVTKILVPLISSFLADVMLFLFLRRSEKLAAFVSGGVMGTAAWLVVFWLYVMLGVPGADRVARIIIPMTFAALLVGALAGWVGYRTYLKMQDSALVKRIRAWG